MRSALSKKDWIEVCLKSFAGRGLWAMESCNPFERSSLGKVFNGTNAYFFLFVFS